MEAQDKAKELVEKYKNIEVTVKGCDDSNPCIISSKMFHNSAKQCAIIAVENEYNSLRVLLFNLRCVKVIESEKVYLHRLQELIDEEQEVIKQIELL